jgi:hypothetical protein
MGHFTWFLWSAEHHWDHPARAITLKWQGYQT